MKRSSNVASENKSGQKVEKKSLRECFVLWKHKGKDGKLDYLSGVTSTQKADEVMTLIAFYNSQKKNAKEPDIRVYELMDNGKRGKDEVASLWSTVSPTTNREYYFGKTNEGEKIIGFKNKKDAEHRTSPDIKVYYTD